MKSVYLFLLIPVVFLITSFMYIEYGGVYLYGVDPEFNYLFNGITLAHLKVHLNAVGHPGTPVQILIAITARVVHLFRPGQSLWDDVMHHPEMYIKAAVYTAAAINAFFLYLLGAGVYRYTKNLVTALVLQLSPFAFLMTLEVSCRLMPELIMTSIISCWIILIVKMIYQSPEQRNYKKYSLLFGILFGFSLADKLTFITFFVLPIFLLPGIRFKLRYTIVSIVAFSLFAFPAMLNFHKFTGWVTDIFIHKGPYGTGATGIVDWHNFADNIMIMIRSSVQLWIPLSATFILALFSIRHNRKDLTVRLAFGIVTVIVLHYVITAKHYAFYYFTPSLLLTIFTGFTAFLLISRMFPKAEKNRLVEFFLILFALVLIMNLLPKMSSQISGLQKRSNEVKTAMKKFEPYFSNKHPKIICAFYYGCAPVEYSLLFGLFESGRYGKELSDEFRKHYPVSIVYLPWSDSFYQGISVVNATEFLEPDTAYILHIADYSEDLLQKLLDRLQTDTLVYKQELKLLEKSNSTGEVLYSFKLKSKND
jgi:hypothetical protein